MTKESRRRNVVPSHLCFFSFRWNGPSNHNSIQAFSHHACTKSGQRHCEVMQWLRCRVSFSLLQLSIAAIRGNGHRPFQHSVKHLDLAIAEGHIPSA